MTAIRSIMANRHKSLSEISQISHVPRSTLAHAWNKPVGNWSVRVLTAFAQGLGYKPEELLDELTKQDREIHVKIKRKKGQKLHETRN